MQKKNIWDLLFWKLLNFERAAMQQSSEFQKDQATLSILSLVVLNFLFAYSSVTSKCFTF